jgi:ribosome recycling factor
VDEHRRAKMTPMTSLDDALATAEHRMSLVLGALERDLATIRVGAASGSLVDGIRVDHHGQRLRLIELASVTIPDPRQIVIRPWDPSALRAIGTAIRHSRIGLTPTVDGGTIRLYVPAITEERRRELAALARQRAERSRAELRTVRHEVLASIRATAAGRDDVRRAEGRLQALTDRAVAEVDRRAADKEAVIVRG